MIVHYHDVLRLRWSDPVTVGELEARVAVDDDTEYLRLAAGDGHSEVKYSYRPAADELEQDERPWTPVAIACGAFLCRRTAERVLVVPSAAVCADCAHHVLEHGTGLDRAARAACTCREDEQP